MIRLPCSIVSVDVQDAMGSHTMNIQGNLIKYNLNQYGKVIGEEPYKMKSELSNTEGHGHGQENLPDYNAVKESIGKQEGCRIQGFFLVNKVPGNFHISSHAFGPIIQRLASEGFYNFDVSHKINHISFGDDKSLQIVRNTFKTGELNPLDNTIKIDNQKKVYEYYTKVYLYIIKLLGCSYHIYRHQRRFFFC